MTWWCAQEIAVLSHCHCPQLTNYYASYVVDSSLWIVMEYLEVGEPHRHCLRDRYSRRAQ
jgi:serine/threonine protein kinase